LLNAVIHEKLNRLQALIYPVLYFLLYKISDGIIVNSEQNKRHFMEVAKIKGDFIKVIYSGIDMERFLNIPDPEIKNNKYVLGMVGRLSKEKGPSYLIEALSFLKEIDFECLIVGDGPLRKELEEQVEKRHLQERVKFLGFQNNVIQFMQKMDVVVLPSLDETFGITIVEAFALKKVVVASDVGGIPELVKHKLTGLLFPAKDSATLAERLLYLHNNKREATKLAKNGYEFAMKKFTSTVMAANTLDYYKTLQKVSARN
jgi:glycosyltransferase involved in cell wall biosynthesis